MTIATAPCVDGNPAKLAAGPSLLERFGFVIAEIGYYALRAQRFAGFADVASVEN